MKKMLNEGNQIHNSISSSSSYFLTSFGSGSGSASQKVMVPTVTVFDSTTLSLSLFFNNINMAFYEVIFQLMCTVPTALIGLLS
jgi:hypothetical protein